MHGCLADCEVRGGRRAEEDRGCGLGGLAAAYCLGQAGHKITVLDSAHAIGEVGAGIQVTPNVNRLLFRWGLRQVLEEVVVTPEALAFHRWETGERIAYTRWGKKIEEDHGAPYYHIHRADFHKILFDLASPHMSLRLKSRVVAIDPSVPNLTLESGEVIKTDLIVGADGVKSFVREVVIGGPDKPVPTGDAVYRAIVSTDEMIKDPQLRSLVDIPEMCGWMGPGRHIMAYNIRAKKEYNLVMAYPDDGSTESWTAEGNPDQMRGLVAGWEPRVQKLYGLVKTALKGKLMDRAPLDTWIHQDDKVILLGDACHPMLPYRAQGAAMAIEDGAVLGNLFSRLENPAQVPKLIHAYETLRLPRASATQASARLNQKIFHLPDGPEQEVRDESMKQAMRIELGQEPSGETLEGNANQWADKSKNVVQFSYDADEEVNRWWAEHGEEVLSVRSSLASKM
ncbi:FAD/NAD P-binding domain-containing protein [Gloeophyllum trabeum ATCC 11539]|uniref:FAD/NAD P-binding domain-containing protein n=1 Tax=Gloeophyllum trabeum (strain ATCC 11539 / FP-39264 / Madison 617) TaxID=670483 RepID=S7RBN2_GLOTA|nr:FAD/NAD P-binding domain-containing protein [Gloeophyllum trabeum ATCC 11539]EPQ51650.1 FAD/NAD P-binding domain-containing protein [Gloeophyllum trabeum ATCC 11539]